MHFGPLNSTGACSPKVCFRAAVVSLAETLPELEGRLELMSPLHLILSASSCKKGRAVWF